MKEAVADHKEFTDFITSMPKWTTHDGITQGYVWGERVFAVGDFHFRLWSSPSVTVPDKWCASCRDQAGGTLTEIYDSSEDVKAWINRLERAIGLIGGLSQCQSPTEARDLLVHLTARDIRTLTTLLDIRKSGSWASALEAIIYRVCGFRINVDQWRLANV